MVTGSPNHITHCISCEENPIIVQSKLIDDDMDDNDGNGNSQTIWVCCSVIPSDNLPVALHCAVVYECYDKYGNKTVCACSANPTGYFGDMTGNDRRNTNCDNWWWPWDGAWGPIVPYCGPLHRGHPDDWLWDELPLDDNFNPIFNPGQHNCTEVDVSNNPDWRECMQSISEAIWNCCVHYEALGDHGPNSNSFLCLIAERCLALNHLPDHLKEHEDDEPTWFGAEGCDYNWVDQFCGQDADEDCSSLCELLLE